MARLWEQIKALRQIASPRNFEVWYQYATGYNPSLNQDINELLAGAGTLAESASGLLDTYQPIAAQAAPLARRFVQEFSEDELVAAIRLVDQLPRLTEHMESDIMPLLATLDRVGPDVHELLNQLREVRQAINGIPGFRMFRRRGEEFDER